MNLTSLGQSVWTSAASTVRAAVAPLVAITPLVSTEPAAAGAVADSFQASSVDRPRARSASGLKELAFPASSNPDVEVQGRFATSTWAWTERLFDSDPHFKQQNFHPRGHQAGAEVVAAFGSDTPHSGNVLLHYAGAPPAGVPHQKHPVVLVHGANKNGDFWWDPEENGSQKGLPQKLRAEGFDVYAVSFAHPHDDNFFEAEQLSNSIKRVKQLTGADQVDLVAHSKGGPPARSYVSDFRKPWMTPYGNDVHRLVLVAAPNGGIDSSFRNSSSNLALAGWSKSPLLNAPMSWDSMRYFGTVPVDTTDKAFDASGKDYWPGQDQILGKWDNKFPLPMWQQDWWTTYHGGTGFVSHSKGIDYYIKQGENYIAGMNDKKISPEVQVAVLAGDNPNLPGILNEYTGPSDGLLFIDSALHVPNTPNVMTKQVLHLNHKSLVSDEKGQTWISDTLKRPDGYKGPMAS